MHRAARLLVPALIVCAAVVALAQGQKRPITEKDIFQFNWIGDPQISPDGSRVTFVKVSVDEKKTGYETSIWAVSMSGGDEPRRMTDGKHDSSPRWSPDGKWLVFVRMPEAGGASTPAAAGGANGAGARPPAPQLYVLPLGGGESWRVTDLPRGAGSPVWSPDSKWIAFTSDTNPDDLAKARKKGPKFAAEKSSGEASSEKSEQKEEAGPGAAKPIPEPESEHESDVRVITRSVYRLNGVGYLDPKHPQQIWIVAAPQSSEDTVNPRQLTSGKFQESEPFWTNDGSHLYFTSVRVEDPSYELPRTELYTVGVNGGD